VRLANESHYELPPIAEWTPWEGTPSPGYHYSQDLSATRVDLLLSGRSPKVVLRNAAAADMVALRYVCVKARDGASGACVVRELPPDQEAIRQFLERLPRRVTWCGEGLPALTQKVLLELLRADRESPSADVRARVLEEQHQVCNSCGAAFHGDLEWDHIAPLRSLCTGTEQSYQAICAACHREKTDQQANPARTLVSRTSTRVWREYVETKRPPPLVWSPHVHSETATLCELDVCRCRKNALAHCAYDLPVLCPYDNIEASRPGHIADFSFVELSGRGRCSALSLLPFVGNM